MLFFQLWRIVKETNTFISFLPKKKHDPKLFNSSIYLFIVFCSSFPMFPYAFNSSSTNNIIVLFFLTFWQWFLSTHDVQIAKCHYIYRKGCRSLLGNVQTNGINVFFSSGDWYKHCRSQTWGNLLQKSTTAALSCSEVCGVCSAVWKCPHATGIRHHYCRSPRLIVARVPGRNTVHS